MSWRDRLQPASFRGVPFEVESHGTTLGRRVAVQRVAGSDIAIAQDLGREPDEHEISAFLFGDDYDAHRQALEAALVTPGPGALTIPRRGDLWARVTRGPITNERKDEGGYCTVRFTVVVEGRDDATLARAPYLGGAMREAADALVKALPSDFSARVDVGAMRPSEVAPMAARTNDMSRVIARATRAASTVALTAASITRELDRLTADVVALLAVPDLYASTVIDLVLTAMNLGAVTVSGIDQASGAPVVVASTLSIGAAARMVDRAWASIRGFGEPYRRFARTVRGRRAEDAERALGLLVRGAALSAVTSTMSRLTIDTSDYARAMLRRAVIEADQLAALDPGDDAAAALGATRYALTEYLLDQAKLRPKVRRVEVNLPRPALVLAYELYGDARRDEEIVAMNGISDPAAVRGTLDVIS